MSQPFDLQAIACKVYSILTDLPDSRDDDRILLSNIWLKESEGLDNKDFFHHFLKGNLSNPETITRIRRKLQEQHVQLRGEKWDVRHNLEGAFCQQLTFFDKW